MTDAIEEAILQDLDVDASVLREVDGLIDWEAIKDEAQTSSWWGSWMSSNSDGELQQGTSPDSCAVLAPPVFVGDQSSAMSLSSTVNDLSSDGSYKERPPPVDESEPDAKRRKL
jgi:hypothetical protein